jgi:hypothetical protein
LIRRRQAQAQRRCFDPHTQTNDARVEFSNYIDRSEDGPGVHNILA